MKKIWVVLAVVVLLLCTGCSYKALDEQIQSRFQQHTDKGVDGYTSDGRAYVEIPPLPEDDMKLKGLGESFSAYKKYIVYGKEEIEKGIEGLTYTLKGVQVFDSIYDAQVDLYGCTLEDTDVLKRTPFILIDVETSYTAPSGGYSEIIADAGELSGMALGSKMNQKMEEELYPEMIYFSLRPKEDDPDLDHRHHFFSYRIKDGETLAFQVGIFCGQEYIDDKNVYLEVNPIPFIDGEVTGDTDRKLFDLFPESEG